jgi:ubiquitin-activating enzyme E1
MKTYLRLGFASLEFLKMVIYKERKIEEFRNAFINLSLPLFVLSEPLPPAQTKSIEYDPVVGGRVRAKPEGFTTWDLQEMCVGWFVFKVLMASLNRHVLSLGLNDTLDHFLKSLGKKFMVKVLILSVGNTCLYNDYLPSHVSRLSIGFQQVKWYIFLRCFMKCFILSLLKPSQNLHLLKDVVPLLLKHLVAMKTG